MEHLKYKDKLLIRRGDNILYGDFGDPYIIRILIRDKQEINKLARTKKLTIELVENNKGAKPIKRAERESIYKAIDLAAYWLKEAIETLAKNNKKN